MAQLLLSAQIRLTVLGGFWLSCFREAYILSVPSTYVGKFEIKVMLAKQTYSKEEQNNLAQTQTNN